MSSTTFQTLALGEVYILQNCIMIPSFKIRQPLTYAKHSREEAGLGIRKKPQECVLLGLVNELLCNLRVLMHNRLNTDE